MKRNRTIAALSTILAAGALAAGVTISSASRSNHDAFPRVRMAAPVTVAPNTRTATAAASNGTFGSAIDTGSTTELQQLIHRPGQYVAGTDTGQWSSMPDFMSWVVNDVKAVWNWYYQQWGLNITSDVAMVFPLPAQSVSTPCGPTNDRSMFYCAPNDTIYFSQALAKSLWSGTFVGYDGGRFKGQGGDFAVVVMLAHEFGHNVEQEYGNLLDGRFKVSQTEQMADCLSGAFTRIAYYQNVLDPNDVSEALATAFVVGDSSPDPKEHHGTGAERVAAWKLGYNSTTGPAPCWSYVR